MLDAFQTLESWTTRIARDLAVLGLAVAVSLAFFQVVTRFVFDAPSTWSETMARSIMIWSVYLGIAAAFRSGAMIAVDVVYRFLHGRSLLLLHSLITAAILAFLLVLAVHGVKMTLRVQNQTIAGLDFSIAWFYAALPTGAVFSILAVVSRYIDLLRGRDGAPAEGPPAEPEAPA